METLTNLRMQHFAALNICNVGLAFFPEPHQRTAFLGHIFHTQTGFVPITPYGSRQLIQQGFRFNLADTAQIVEQRLLLGQDLPPGFLMLKTATATDIEMRTFWLYTVRRSLEQFTQSAFIVLTRTPGV